MKLLIRNLPRTTTETELRAMFAEHGSVQSCSLVMDKDTNSSKGFGFVEMPKAGEAKAAIKTLNGLEMDGNRIRVKKAETNPGEAADD
ncbi:RNA-binding protein [Methylomonas sp. MO1]|jgi:RNA recognition motif-containing protein|uniref:RNA-binding protein n=1 Tax=Methylomonas methanica TaxID=421 RepID=A0A177MNA0_METMH|nr:MULTISPECIES: RNA-binding protein [Methylomonas]MDT4292262.1 RNA-binding protein [Methylomonas sp. MO1]OAI07072.1 RNA-binding protein [Methylomonas methanica]